MNLLQMSFSGAVMILVIVAIRALTIHKLPKKAFLALWSIVLLRLFMPFTCPSVFSAYAFVEQHTSVVQTMQYTPMAQVFPLETTEQMAAITYDVPINAEAGFSIPIWTIIWMIGALSCLLFFAVSYYRYYREFQISLPVEQNFVQNWLHAHPLKRRLAIRQSGQIDAPLTYGIVRPVILLPKATDWADEEALQYVLTHEYIHIRRFDTLTKLILIAALCLHWFNPLVWVMYGLVNRDLELSCDEAVVHFFGTETKAAYALTLIHMEEHKGGFITLYSGFSKNAIEERITAIMKTKKTSILAAIVAIALIVIVPAVFATSAASHQSSVIPGTSFTDEEYAQLLALQYDGYKDMTVAEFQRRVWKQTDTLEYMHLLERFWQDETIYSMRDTNEIAGFLCNTLVPLTAEKWQTRDFSGYAATDRPEEADQATIEYQFALTIINADTLTVGEYDTARLEMQQGWQRFLQSKTPEELQNEQGMQEAIQAEMESRIKRLASESLQIQIKNYSYIPLQSLLDTNAAQYEEELEPRQYPPGTEDDYRSLLALKIPNYEQMTVVDFNEALLAWGNADFDRTQRIQEDIGRNEFQVDLSEEERSFVAFTMILSNEENFRMIQSLKTGKREENPGYGGVNLHKESDDGYAWCSLYYQLSYHIVDKDSLTIAERDRCVGNVVGGIQKFWEQIDMDDLLAMSERELKSFCQDLASANSNEQITITINKKQFQFESMDERGLMYSKEWMEKI